MRLRFSALALLATLSAGAPAQAQMYPGEDVTVNPSATGSRVLLYPGGQYGRVVHPLLQPGEPDPNAPIHLHMPVKHRAVHRVAKAKPKVETAAAQPRTQSRAPQETMPFSALPSESAATLVTPEPMRPAPKQPATQPAKKVAIAKPAPAPAKPKVAPKAPAAASDSDMTFLSGQATAPAAAPPPAKVAANEPAPASTGSLLKRNSIPFASGAEEPAPSVLDTVKAMSGDLNNALTNGSARIQLEAYAGKQGDKSSDARRLSLKRALIIRQLLIDDGVPSERIDVRAMGGASDGVPDRVDIFVRA